MTAKILIIFSIAIFISTSKISAQLSTQPITAASFPKEVVPVDAGTIEFDAKMTGFGGYIPWGGIEPHFFEIYDGTSTFHMGFNGNDGAANGGLVGTVGSNFFCGTGLFGTWYFEDIYDSGEVDQWHHYKFIWNKDGLAKSHDKRKVEIYIDGVLNSTRWSALYDQTFPPLTDGTFNLITTDNTDYLSGEVAIDELKIYDGDGNLLLYNKLGSQQEIENSEVGLNGSFNGFGDAHFVPGTDGYAVEAHPVSGIGSADACNAPTGLKTNNITATSAKLNWDAVAGAEGYRIKYKVENTSDWTRVHAKGSSLSKPLQGLLPNTTYVWEISTKCDSAQHSPYSSKVTFTTVSQKENIMNNASNFNFSIYPNPATDVAVIHFSLGHSSHVSIKVFDLSGKEIESLLNEDIQRGEHSLQLNTNHFSQGVYLVKMISDFGIENQKLIVQ